MVKSGITRRIDELGRIVIPKEIRRNLKIQDSDEMDISLDGNSIVLNKHEIENDKVVNKFVYIISKFLTKNVLFTSKEKIISYSIVNKEKIENLELSDEIKSIINNRKSIDSDSNFKLFNSDEYYYIIHPLVINGDLFGSIILYSKERISDVDNKLFAFSKMFLENYLE